MPITIYVKASHPLTPTMGELDALSDILTTAILKDGTFRHYSGAAKIGFKENGFAISYQGISTKDEKLINYLTRLVAYLLYAENLSDAYEVLEIASVTAEKDKVLSLKDFVPKSEREALFSKYENEDVSEGHLCALSNFFMENPVYLGGRTQTKFEWNQLKYWLFQQDKLIDPYTKLPITFSDIHFDQALKSEIDAYVRANLRNKILANQEKLKVVLAKVKIEGTDDKAIKGALRRAAHQGWYPELDYLIKQLRTVNDQASSNKRTALHWAVINGHVTCAKKLLEAGADPEIKDSFDKSCKDYAAASSNQALKDLFKDEMLERIENIFLQSVFLAFIEQVFAPNNAPRPQ